MPQKAHGIMFHHFHDDKHIVQQGSISAEEFNNLLTYYGRNHNIISADEFLYKSKHNCLKKNDVCLTFDDSLLCQYDVAYPVLEQKGIKAFWFVYTSPYYGILEKLEIYRHFRFSKFADIDDFYNAFFKIAKEENEYVSTKLENFDPNKYAKNSPFYTPNDKRFRYLRDYVLGELHYNQIMDKMIEYHQYNVHESANNLWINQDQIKKLHSTGHIIGLHSHTHPTNMGSKPFIDQKNEYRKNYDSLKSILGINIISASYPCNSYNEDTIYVMKELGIEIAFRANMQNERISSHIKLEYAREDHANILRVMKDDLR